MTHGYPAPPPPARRPVRMLVTGIVLSVLAVLGLATALVLGLRGTVGAVSDALDVRGQLMAQVDVPGTTTVTLQPGEYVVLALGADLVTGGTGTSSSTGRTSSASTLRATDFAVPDVELTGPDGAVALRPPGASSLVSTSSLDAVAVHSVTVTAAGSYTLAATGSGADVTQVGLRPAADVGAVVRSALTWVVVGLVSGVALLVGLGLTVGGAVRRARSR